jgi:hypothetical protein
LSLYTELLRRDIFSEIQLQVYGVLGTSVSGDKAFLAVG